MKRIVLVLGVLLSSLVHAQDMLDLFGDDKRSFALLPSEVISSGVVGDVQFSPSGRYITYTKIEIQVIEAAVLGQLSELSKPKAPAWYRYDRKSKVSIKIPTPDTTREVIVLGDDRSVYFCGPQPSDPQGFIDLSSGAISRTNFDFEKLSYLGDRPEAPYFIVKSGEQGVQLVKPNGQTLSINIPPKMFIVRPYKSDGKVMTFAAMFRGDGGKTGFFNYQISDGSTNFVEMDRDKWRKELYQDEQNPMFTFEKLGDLNYVKLQGLPKKLVTDLPTKGKLGRSDCRPRFGPTNDCVAFEDSGSLLIRAIKPIDPSLARKMKAVADQKKAMDDAKQTAMALILYASDMDDVLPGAEGWDTKVLPYTLDSDMLKNFNYTYRGGNMSNITDPANTELGFTMGPGGRAVAYADGHVKWVPNP